MDWFEVTTCNMASVRIHTISNQSFNFIRLMILVLALSIVEVEVFFLEKNLNFILDLFLVKRIYDRQQRGIVLFKFALSVDERL